MLYERTSFGDVVGSELSNFVSQDSLLSGLLKRVVLLLIIGSSFGMLHSSSGTY